ncbi:MAG: aromatic ring-hydroxylating dioxygenase subunit alpha [Acidimicrobiia bacterium]
MSRSAAPLPADEIARALAPLGRACMLPGAAYTEDAVLAWEREHLFDAAWMCTGRAPDTEPGSQCAASMGWGSRLLVRDDNGQLRAFANVCRHRGHELLAIGESATRPQVRCPYHGWTYALDGTLKHVTGGDVRDPDSCALGEVRANEWRGWAFVNASSTAAPLERGLAGLDKILAPYDPGGLVAVERREYVVEANWKVLHENYQECLHCPRIHPELCRVSPPESGDNLAPGPAWVGGWMDLRDGAETMSMTGELVGAIHPGLDELTRRRVGYFAVLPNLLVSAHPDYVLTHRFEPLTPSTTRVECEWLVEPDVDDIGGAVELWDLTNRQDWAACESVQRGLASGAYRPGPILEREDAVHHFVGLIAAAYLGRAPAPD